MVRRAHGAWRGFRVYRRVGDAPWQCLAPNVQPREGGRRYLDTEVEPGVRYEYQVEGFGSAGSAGRFGPVSAVATAPEDLAVRVLPNPGMGPITVSLALPKAGDVLIRVFQQLREGI